MSTGRSLRRLLDGLKRDESGSELIEFSIASTLLLMTIFGILDCSRALYSYHYCAQVAREATRYASVRGATWTGTSCATPSTFSCAANSTDVTNYVKSITPFGFSASNLVVTTTWPGTNATGTSCNLLLIYNSPGCMVNVKVAYAYSYVLPFLPRTALALSSTSRLSITQ
jgi:Flp pilus assembly protein TadG